jgi:hypothetical protein
VAIPWRCLCSARWGREVARAAVVARAGDLVAMPREGEAGVELRQRGAAAGVELRLWTATPPPRQRAGDDDMWLRGGLLASTRVPAGKTAASTQAWHRVLAGAGSGRPWWGLHSLRSSLSVVVVAACVQS